MNTKRLLLELANGAAIPGAFKNVDKIICDVSKETGLKLNRLSGGSLGGCLKPPKNKYPKVLLEAHLDEIGFVVTSIEKNGFVKIQPCGGIDRRILSSCEVIIYGKKSVYGVVVSNPAHIGRQTLKQNNCQNEDIVVDTGMSRDKLKLFISLGDRVGFAPKSCQMLNGKVASKSLDNRIGVVVLLLVLSEIKKLSLNLGINVLFSNQEETTSAGAKTGGYSLFSDYALSVDTSFALQRTANKQKCGVFLKGSMIGCSPILDRELFERLVRVAKEKNIPYQIEVMGNKTSTDADVLAVVKTGMKIALCSVPIKNMHTPSEIVCLDDIENTAKLIVLFLKNLDTEIKR